MMFEAGKYYLTRNGCVAFVRAIVRDGFGYPLRGRVFKPGGSPDGVIERRAECLTKCVYRVAIQRVEVKDE